MAEQANVYVKNNLTDAINVIRYCFPGGNSDLDISIASEDEEMIYLVRTQTYLVLKAPNGVDTESCPFSVSNEDLLSWSTTDGHWTVEIKPNNLPPDTPTDVNVYVGEDPP
jgi:hypothetical protein